MSENKDLGGVLNATDMDRIYDDSVSVTMAFSIKRALEDDKSQAIKGSLEFDFAGYSQREALNKACQQLKVDWANGLRMNKAWTGPVPKMNETIKIKVSEYFSSKERVKVALTPENLLAQFGGDLEAVKAALDVAAANKAIEEKAKGIEHIDPEEHEKMLAEKREKYLAEEAEKQAKAEQELEASRIAEEEAEKKRKATLAKQAKGKK